MNGKTALEWIGQKEETLSALQEAIHRLEREREEGDIKAIVPIVWQAKELINRLLED